MRSEGVERHTSCQYDVTNALNHAAPHCYFEHTRRLGSARGPASGQRLVRDVRPHSTVVSPQPALLSLIHDLHPSSHLIILHSSSYSSLYSSSSPFSLPHRHSHYERRHYHPGAAVRPPKRLRRPYHEGLGHPHHPVRPHSFGSTNSSYWQAGNPKGKPGECY